MHRTPAMAAETRGKTSVPPTPESARQSFNRVLFELSNAKNTALVHSIPRENTELLITSLEADKRVGEGPWRYSDFLSVAIVRTIPADLNFYRFSYNSLTQSFYAKKPCELHTSVVKWSRAEIISMLFTEFLNSDEVSSIEILVGSSMSTTLLSSFHRFLIERSHFWDEGPLRIFKKTAGCSLPSSGNLLPKYRLRGRVCGVS